MKGRKHAKLVALLSSRTFTGVLRKIFHILFPLLHNVPIPDLLLASVSVKILQILSDEREKAARLVGL